MKKISLRNYRSRGFTLPELIIVISIIGILSTIGIMSWSGSQNKARENAAVSTLAKVKLELGEYFTDMNNYPVDKTAVCDKTADYVVISSNDLHNEYCDGDKSANYLYTASPSGCDNSETACTSYVLTAKKAIWSGSTDKTLEP